MGIQQILAEKARFSHCYVSERQLWGECLWRKKLNNPLYLCRYCHIHCLNCCSSHFSSEHGWNQFFWISTDQGNYNELTRRAAKAACCPKQHTRVPALQRSCPLPPLCSTLHRPAGSWSLGQPQSAQQSQHSWLHAAECTGQRDVMRATMQPATLVLWFWKERTNCSWNLLPTPSSVPFITIVGLFYN